MAENTPYLLVPVAVEALVVNKSDLHTTTWSIAPKEYAGLSKFEPIEPPPFVRLNGMPKTGVTLHWALPDALTRGRPDSSGKLHFASVPNRWLVLRLADKDVDAMKAWVVESDFLDVGDGSNWYPHPSGSGLTRLGRAVPLSEWLTPAKHAGSRAQSAEARITSLGLRDSNDRVIGAADPSFAAYVANVQDVFSFRDSLDDISPEEPLSLNYMVMGWYAPASESDDMPPQDPLNLQDHLGFKETRWSTPEQWSALMKELGWSVGDEKDLESALNSISPSGLPARDRFPSRILCHGMVYGVNWTGLENGAPQPFQKGQDSPFAEIALKRRGLPDDPNPAVSRSTQPQVVIANSTVDAFATLFEFLFEKDDTAADFGKLFQALSYDLTNTFNSTDGELELQRRIRQGWFSALDGGSVWELAVDRLPDPATPPTEPKSQEKAPDPSPAQSKAVSDLNKAQADLDRARREFADAQWDLYSRWWKSARLPHLDPKPNGISGDPEQAVGLASSKQRADQKSNAMRTAVNVVANAKGAVDQALSMSPPNPRFAFRLVETKGPRFYRPSDPVLLVYGVRRSEKHGGDGRFTVDNTLFCRFAGQQGTPLADAGQQIRSLTIDGVKLGTDAVTDKWFGALKVAVSEPVLSRRIPSPALGLAAEFALLNPAWAHRLIALSGTNTTVGLLRRQQSIPWGDFGVQTSTAALTQSAGFEGIWPSSVAVDAWVQPWTPLFLNWRVTWFPTAALPKDMRGEWTFDGSDYKWTGLGRLDYSIAVTVQGRSILAAPSTKAFAKAVFDLQSPQVDEQQRALELAEAKLSANAEQLTRLLAGKTTLSPEETIEKQALTNARPGLQSARDEARAEYERRFANRQAIVDALTSVDLLGQPLAGFHDALLMRDPGQYYDPPDVTPGGAQVGDLLRNGVRAAPMPYSFGDPNSLFHPIRAGHIRFDRVWIVDAFGQVFDPMKEQGVSASAFTVLRGSGMETLGLTHQRRDTQALQLPPRLVQPSRLNMRFVDGRTVSPSPVDSSKDSEANTVCGWLLPNQLDDSIVVFDELGNSLGSIVLTGSGSEKNVLWLAAIGSSTAVESETAILNPHLRGLVRAFFDPGLARPGDAFIDWMAAINATLWTTEPLGKRGDNLSVLIGRPLAVVRLLVGLELAEALATNQLWAKTNEADTLKFEEVSFDVQLGDRTVRQDGTLGFYRPLSGAQSGAADYSTFFAVMSNLDLAQRTTPGTAKFIQNGRLSIKVNESILVTAVIDPRGEVNATSGLVPPKAIRLPNTFVDKALERMDVTFRVGPVLTEPKALRLPLPVNVTGSWVWIERTGVRLAGKTANEMAAPVKNIDAADEQARLPVEAIHIREGWLQLSDAVGAKEN